MELTENMEEFLNDLIGKRMEQVYWCFSYFLTDVNKNIQKTFQ